MKIRTIHYRRTKQVAPYEPEVIELIIDLEEGDTVDNAIATARFVVAKQFGEKIDLRCVCTSDTLLAHGCCCGIK